MVSELLVSKPRSKPICLNVSRNTRLCHFFSHLFTIGFHSCDNSSEFDTRWNKSVAGQKTFEKIVTSCTSVDDKDKLIDDLIRLLSDKTQ